MSRIEPNKVVNLGGSSSVIAFMMSSRLFPSKGFFKVKSSYRTHAADLLNKKI